MDHTVNLVLDDGESAIFGYGSLLLKRHMEFTLGRKYEKPFLACVLDGWFRTWDVIMQNKNFYADTPSGRLVPENIIYLNIHPRTGGVLNGVVFIVRPEELAAFDRREWIYDRRTVTQDLKGVKIVGGEAFAYVAKPELILPPEPSRGYAAIRRTYLNVIDEGLSDWGSDFRRLYENSTQAVPVDLVIDDHKLDDGTHPLLADFRRPV